jgi:hypothetical protein
MAFPETPKPATARDTRKPASNVGRFAGGVDTNLALIDLQAQRLSRIFALPEALALTVASLHYKELAS